MSKTKTTSKNKLRAAEDAEDGFTGSDVFARAQDRLCEKFHELARSKGWYEDESDLDPHPLPGVNPKAVVNFIMKKLMLSVSELAEACEEVRDGRDLDEVRYSPTGKPEGFLVEIADCEIRLKDLVGALMYYGLVKRSYGTVLMEKHAYNATRPHRHGGKLA